MIINLLFIIIYAKASLLKNEAQVLSEIQNKTVKIEIYKENKLLSVGAGFFVAKDGKIITNRHVMKPFLDDPTTKLSILNINLKPFKNISILRCAEAMLDLCLIKVEDESAHKYFALHEESIGIGHKTFSLGHCQKNFNQKQGVVKIAEAKRERYAKFFNTKEIESTKMIETTTPFCPGDSGGPLYDDQGKLLGINTERVIQKDLYLSISTKEILQFTSGSFQAEPIISTRIKENKTNRNPLKSVR